MDIFTLNQREINGCKEIKIYDFYLQRKCLCEFFPAYLNVTQKRAKNKKELIQSDIIYLSVLYFLTKRTKTKTNINSQGQSCGLPFLFSFVKAIGVLSISSL